MKRLALLALGVIAVSTSAFAQAPDDAAAKAVLALPANLREAAGVIKWQPDFPYDTLKKGTNNLVCYDLPVMLKHPQLPLEWTTMANVDRLAQHRRLRAE